MTEKRFENKGRVIYDSQTYDEYHCDFFAGLEEITDLLNTQQATINKLKKARDESDTFIGKKGLGAEFLNWCVANE